MLIVTDKNRDFFVGRIFRFDRIDLDGTLVLCMRSIGQRTGVDG